MRERLARLVAFSVGPCLALVLLGVSASAQQGVQYDRKAVFITHVPHLSKVGAGAAAAPSAQPSTAAATFTSPTYTVGPTVTPTTTIPEAEEHVAVDPNSASNYVAAISDFSQRGGFNTTKWVISTDGGGTWRESFVPLDANGFPTTSDGQSWQANSDPVVAISRTGNVYLADLYINASNSANGFYVSQSTLTNLTAAGSNFTSTNLVAGNLDPLATTLEDKPWIAVDNSSSPTSGTLYASWTHFDGCFSFAGFIFCLTDSIVVSHSADGVNWTAPVHIDPSAQDGAVQGSQVAVGPDGSVYVVYEVFLSRGKRQHFLAKSTDGGATFSSPVAITPSFSELTFSSTYRKNSFAALAVSPANGNVYAVYADQPNKSVGAQVQFIASTNGGASFSAPVTINDNSAGQQFMPAVAVDSSGVIHASWFDTRNSPSNSSIYDIFASFSKDAGGTFAVNARVTPTSINADSASFIGDYSGNAAAAGTAHPVWTSGGFNNGSLQTATLTLP